MATPFDRVRKLIHLSIRLTGEDDEWCVSIDGIEENYDDLSSTTNREELLQEEARAVLEHQLDTLNDIDDKAARTVRITALLVGAIFGAISFGDASSLIVNQYTWWGSVSLILAVVLGMTTYSQSSPYVGPKPDDWERLLETSSSRAEMLDTLVSEGYSGWVEYNDTVNEIDSYFLELTQWALATSLLLFGVGLTAEFVPSASYVPQLPSLARFSYSLSVFPLTPASTPVLVLFVVSTLLYLYSLVVKSRTP